MIKTFEEWVTTITIKAPPHVCEELHDELKVALLELYDLYCRDEQFKLEMTLCLYGPEETADARAWFNLGWAAKGSL